MAPKNNCGHRSCLTWLLGVFVTVAVMTSNASNDSLPSPEIRWPAIHATDLYVTPVWYVIGIPGNILAFMVWVQRRMRPSSGCYLAALALDECLFLIMQVNVRLSTYKICDVSVQLAYFSYF